MNGEYGLHEAREKLSDRDLMLHFESIGDNCELGLVQRKAGAEPLGLLRFSGVPVRNLIKALEQRFEGIADPDQIRLQVENGEYMVKLARYGFLYHAFVLEHEMESAALHRREVRRTGFLTNKLIGDLEHPAKILVFRQNEPLLAQDLVRLRSALSRYAAQTLLWVQEAEPGRPPGTVEVPDDNLMMGYVRWLAPRENAHHIDHVSWIRVCRTAHALWQQARETGKPLSNITPSFTPEKPIWVEARFGVGGNGPEKTGFGWSAPEDGFTWSVGEQSLLVLDRPPEAPSYALDLEIVPFLAPPSVPAQRLSVTVNGALVHHFDSVPRGRISCTIPGNVVHGREKIEILFGHPDAARPSEVAGEKDDRPLAIAFYSLTLQGQE
jgi:hypothetical protein